ncbi:Conserved_hypothetical protein [Hexamita inflata]|uniref:Uncharacterized protein n=1 Tax=Hexamita inflata TaxID=28002 RepID=A0AA86PW44_9EUKA|nr:Conserved hypothetical protein [Hexamita inflata]
MVVYAGETKSVMVMDNRYLVVCNNGQLFDVVLKVCVARNTCLAASNKYIFKAMCVKQCPNLYRFANIGTEKICYQQCPFNLGYADPAFIDLSNSLNNMCILCSGATLKVDSTGCVASCAGGLFSFNKGCYSACPSGTIQSGSTCTAPMSESDCPSGFYIILSTFSTNQYFNKCSSSRPAGLFQSAPGSQTYTWSCAGRVLLNGSCDTTNAIPCSDQSGLTILPVINTVGSTNFCQLACFTQNVNNSNICSATCPQMQYPQWLTGICLNCITTIYDGGLFWNRMNAKCVPTCNYVNQTNSQICEVQNNATNCPFYITAGSSQFLCIRQCQPNCYISSNLCVMSCPLAQIYIQSDRKNCGATCLANEKIIVQSASEVYCVQQCPWNYQVINQNVYSTYQQCIPQIPFAINTNMCALMLQQRIWKSYNQCELQNTLNLRQWINYQSITLGDSSINMESVIVTNLAFDGSSFALLQIPSTSHLTNGLFIVDTEIDMGQATYSSLLDIHVSLFDRVYSDVKNVVVCGNIKLTNVNSAVTKIVLSKLFGNVNVPLSQRVGAGSSFTNVSSSLRFFVNGDEITADNQVVSSIPSTTIKLVNSFEEAMSAAELGADPSGYVMNVGPAPKTVAQMVADGELFSSSVVVANRSGPAQTLQVYTAFDPVLYPNAYQDYYPSAYSVYLEKMDQISGLEQYYFGVFDTLLNAPVTASDVRMVVYAGETKSVMVMDNRYLVVCNNGQLFDVVLKVCVARNTCLAASNKYIFKAMCVKQCPNLYRFANIGTEKICYQQCPFNLGYADPAFIDLSNSLNNMCILCSGATLKVDSTGCVASCAGGLFSFNKGCYSACPSGTIQSGSTCSAPMSESDCPSGFYIILSTFSTNQYFNKCSSSRPAGLFQSAPGSQTYTWSCAGRVLLNGSCDTTNAIPCSDQSGLTILPVINTVGSTNFCQLACFTQNVNNSNICSATCPQMQYPQWLTGICLNCITTIYDGGLFWNRMNAKCVPTCNYVNQTNSQICEVQNNATNCPFYITAGSSQFLCIRQCQPNCYISSNLCVMSCPLAQIYIQSDRKNCGATCLANEKIIVQSATEVYCVQQCPWNYQAINQNVYSTYQQCIPQIPFAINTNLCALMLQQRIWKSYYQCELQNTLNLRQWTNYQSITLGDSSINMESVIVTNLAFDGSSFALLQIPSTSHLTNGLFIVDSEIDMGQATYSSLLDIHVSLFDRVYSDVKNVVVCGNIKLTNVNSAVTKIVLSKLFGNVNVPLSQRVGAGSSFTNVSSSLRFFVNGDEITADNQVVSSIPSTTIKLVNSFEEAMSAAELGADPSGYVMNVGPAPKTVAQMVADGELFSSSVVVANRSGPAQTLQVYTAFDPVLYPNAYQDYYPSAYSVYLEKMDQISGLEQYYFGVFDTLLNAPVTASDVRMVVYAGETKSVMVMDNRYLVVCNNGQLFDVVLKVCVARNTCLAASNKYIFKAMCVKQCPNLYRFANIGTEKICYQQCPFNLGYADPAFIDLSNSLNNMCILCSGATLKVDSTGCVASCAGGLFSFNKGCYSACPSGTIQSGSTCTAPMSESDCPSGFYIILSTFSTNQYFNKCSSSRPAGLFQSAPGSQTYTWSCAGRVLLNGSCDTTNAIPCSDQSGLTILPVINTVGSTNFCQLACFTQNVNNSNICSATCPQMQYPQWLTGICLNCITTIYDGGLFWNRMNAKCVPTCNYVNQSQLQKICEQSTDIINCPVIVNINICLLQCLNDFYLNNISSPKVCSANNCNETNGKYINQGLKLCFACTDNYYSDFSMIICAMDNCVTQTDGYFYHFNSSYKICVSQANCFTAGNYYVGSFTSKVCSIDKCQQTQGYYYKDSLDHKICLDCADISTNYYIDYNLKWCSNDQCFSETAGNHKYYYVSINGAKICSNCTSNIFEEEVVDGARCSSDSCLVTSNGVYHLNANLSKICDLCAINIFTDASLTQCRRNPSDCTSTSNIYKFALDGIKKFCYSCDQVTDYLYGLECKSAKCQYFISFQQVGVSLNQCSLDACVSQTAGVYQYKTGVITDDLVCTPCTGTFMYLSDLLCSDVECEFYHSYPQLSAPTKLCSTCVQYMIISGKKVCDLCTGLYLPTYLYKYGNECKNTTCPFFLALADKTCSETCAETNGLFYVDGPKICTPCDGTNGFTYKTGLQCSQTPCEYYTDLTLKECSTGTCPETNNVFYTAGLDKICMWCAQDGFKMFNGTCYEKCPAAAPFLLINQKQCDTECHGQTIYQIGDQKNCLTSCDSQYYLGQAENSYKICVNCSADKIAERNTNQCILKTNCIYFNFDIPVCESGLGLTCQKIKIKDTNTFYCMQNCTGYLEYQNQCYSKCPDGTLVDSTGTICVTTCSFYRLINILGVLQPQCQLDTCNDYQYLQSSTNNQVIGCFVQCPAGTIKTRQMTCVDTCTIYDQYPSPNFCETPGSQYCINYRILTTNVYVCTICTSQEFYIGIECVQNCDNQFVLASNKSICTSNCGLYPKGYINSTFNNVHVSICYETCPFNYPEYDTQTLMQTQRCFASNCSITGKYLEVNLKCVTICASKCYIVSLEQDNRFQCQDINATCERHIINDGMKECYSACPLVNPFLNGSECLKSCDPYMNDPKSPTQKLCLSSCGGVNPPYTLNDADGRTQCTSSCGDLFVQQVGKKFSCVSFCQFYTWDGSSKICTSTCEYYRIDPVKDKLAYWCSDSCAALNMIYSVVDGVGKNQCVSSCPAAYPLLDGIVCKDYCLFIVEQQITDVSKFKCQAGLCPKFYQLYPADNSIRICRQNCVGSAPYVFGSQCVSNCGLSASKYVGPDGLTCVSTCSGETAMNKTTPVWFCDSKCDFYSDSGAKTCSSAGTISHPYRQVYQQIVTNGVTTTRYQYVSSCPNNEYAVVGGVSVCQTCTLYELVGAAHKCVSSCSASQVQFKYQCFTGLCKDILGVGSSFYSGLDKKCSQTCGDYFVYDQVSFQCSSTCPANSVYFVSGGQQICSFSCAGTNDYVTLDSRYAINGVGQCVQICPVGSFKELLQAGDTYKYCASQCAGKQYTVVAGEQTCVSACPFYAMEVGGVKRCYDSCGDSAQNKIHVVISGSETQCVSHCPPSHPFMAANGDLECIQTCPNLFYSLVGNVRKCLDSCSLNASVEVLFSVPSHQLCTGACGDQQMFLRDSGAVGTCVEVCPLTKNYYDSNRECQSECVPKVYRIDGAQKQCMAFCSNPYTRIVIDNDYQQCNLVCSGLTPYMKLDNICVSLCPVGTYLHDKICKLSCPSTMKYALFQSGHHICSTTCPSLIFSSQSGAQNLFCQDSCISPNLFRNDVSSGYTQCLTQCGVGEYQHSTRECNAQNCLQDPVNTFVSDWVCLLVCPDFVDLSDYSCKATCSGSFSGYVQQMVMSQNSRVCYPTCPTNFIDLRASSQFKSTGVCVTYCPTAETLYQEPFSATQFYCTQKCSDANRFVQPDLVYCGNTCASTFFQQNETGHNFCISSCDMPLGRLSIYGITQCMVCPKYVSEVDQACLATCDFSNVSLGAQICRMTGGARNTATCPVYTNNAAPFLCIQACFTMRDGPWCVQDCSVTGKRFVPESGFDCASSCPYFYEFQQIFGVEQPRCNATCNYMRSTADVKECQRYCYSNSSLFINGLTYCSNCSVTTTLFVSNLQFSCSQNNCAANQISQKICADLNCDSIPVHSDFQNFTGFVCYDNFSFNYSTPAKTLQVSGMPVSAISPQGDFGTVLLQNGSALHFDGSAFTKIPVNEAVQLQSLTLPPLHDALHPVFTLKNGSILSSQLLERTDFLNNEAVKNMTGLDLNGKSGVNYLLTDKSLYFRGSCELDMCGRDQSGNAFQKLFNNKPFVHGMWTKIDLQKSGFSFEAGEVREISAFGLALLFTLKSGQKYVWGYNFNGRLCDANVDQIVISDFSAYDQISVSNNASVMSVGQTVFYCGASISQDAFDFSTVVSTPTQLELMFPQIMGWKFSDNTITGISSVQNGFVLRTNAQIFGVGQCVAFDCINFIGQKIFYSGNISLLQITSQNISIIGNSRSSIVFVQKIIQIVTEPIPETPNDKPTNEYIDQVQTLASNNKSSYLIIGILGVDVVAILASIYFGVKIRKHYKQRNELVEVTIKGVDQNEFLIPDDEYSIEQVNERLRYKEIMFDDDFGEF